MYYLVYKHITKRKPLMARPKKVSLDKNESKLKGHIAVLMTKEKQYREKAQQLTDENAALKKQILELTKVVAQVKTLITSTSFDKASTGKTTKTRAKKTKMTAVVVKAATKGKRGRPRKVA